MYKRAASRCPWRDMPRQGLKMFHRKVEKHFEIHFLFYIGEFYAYFNRKQKIFHFWRWEFFPKRQLFFQEKKLVLFQRFFVNVFSNMIDDNRSTILISSFPFFILRCNMNTHRQKFWQDTKWMSTEEKSFPIALIHARTILVELSLTNI